MVELCEIHTVPELFIPGKPALAQEFFAKTAASEAVIISFAEHNGSYTAAVNSAPFFGGELRGYLSVPSFHQNFDVEQGYIKSPEIQAQLAITVKSLQD